MQYNEYIQNEIIFLLFKSSKQQNLKVENEVGLFFNKKRVPPPFALQSRKFAPPGRNRKLRPCVQSPPHIVQSPPLDENSI